MIAAAFLGEAIRGSEAGDLIAHAKSLAAPSHWKAEFTNVVWKAVVFHALPADRADEIIGCANLAPIASVDVSELWHGALARSIAARHSAYDTLFVELAIREGIPMASYDEGLRRKFPEIVCSPSVLLREMT